MRFMCLTVSAGLWVALATSGNVRAEEAVRPATGGPVVEIAICLDTSGSMNALIESAKRRLWTIVNLLATAQPAPQLRVAVYSYGNNSYGAQTGWVRRDLELSTDLDEAYKALNALRIGGSTEYVARVSRDAVRDLKWSTEEKAVRLLFVCGNESANQDPAVTLASVADEAKKKGITISTIFCGPEQHADSAGWRDFAHLCGGKYVTISQQRGATETVVATPFDDEIAKLGVKINDTYVWYGKKGEAAAKNQAAQDGNAAKFREAGVERGITKATGLYRNSTCDLIDRMKDEKDFDVKKLKDEELPEEMKKIPVEDRTAYLVKKAAERDEIKKKIADLATRRTQFIEEQRKKTPPTNAEKSLEDALRGVIRELGGAKGLKFKD